MFMDPLFPVEDKICREADSGNDDLASFLFTDELTGLQNRRSFRYHIERFREQADRKNNRFSLLYIDVDHFRAFKDEFGLDASESILTELAGHLIDEFADSGVVFRYAGDEFLVILPGASESQAVMKAKQFQNRTANVRVTISIAIAIYPDHASSIPSILQMLDLTLKACKSCETDRVLSVSSLQSSSRPKAASSRSHAVIGRTDQTNRLQLIFEQCKQGSSRFVFITGEEGIGKTHLLQDFLNERRGDCFIFSNSLDGIKHAPNEVLRSALRNGISDSLPASFKDLLTFHESDEEFCDSIEKVIRTAAGIRPVVLALDDVQSHDALVLSLLQYLSRECRNLRLMVIAVIRKDLEMTAILNWFIKSMTQAGLFEEMNLSALSVEDCGLVLSNIFEGTSVSETFRNWIYKETIGNPSYIEELIHLAAEEGLIVLSNGAVHIKETDRVLIPDSVRDPMLRRIKNLGEVQQHILGLAAVVGYEFDNEFVSRLFSRTNNYREEMIEELIQLQFFRKSDQGKLHFYSRRIRDLIYEEMGKFNRKMFHERVAEELEKVNQTDSEKWPELAYHYARTGNLTKAIHYMNPGEPSVGTLNKLTKNDEVQQR